jgi:hypothetical protein
VCESEARFNFLTSLLPCKVTHLSSMELTVTYGEWHSLHLRLSSGLSSGSSGAVADSEWRVKGGTPVHRAALLAPFNVQAMVAACKVTADVPALLQAISCITVRVARLVGEVDAVSVKNGKAEFSLSKASKASDANARGGVGCGVGGVSVEATVSNFGTRHKFVVAVPVQWPTLMGASDWASNVSVMSSSHMTTAKDGTAEAAAFEAKVKATAKTVWLDGAKGGMASGYAHGFLAELVGSLERL